MNLKRIILLSAAVAVAGAAIAQNSSDEILMTIDGEGFTKSEFEYIYKKNLQQQIDAKSLDEYIDMFKDYKLKVKEAEAQGLDTVATFAKELKGYRDQLAQPYLVDQNRDEELAKEAYERLKESVEVEHILAAIKEDDPAKTKEAAYKKINEALARVKAGEDFKKIAKEYSDDPSVAKNDGYIGVIKGFQTVYPFEEAAYATPVGTVSNPVLTQFGYHIIKVLDRQPDAGEIKTAHIMLLCGKTATDAEVAAQQAKIDEIYAELKAGADFDELVQKYSEDNNSKKNNGQLNWFSKGRMIKDFSDAAFAIESVGDISEPIRTPFGFHIIKLIDKRDIKPYNEMHDEIMRRMSRDSRGQQGQKKLVERLKVDYNYAINAAAMETLNTLAKTIAPNTKEFAAAIADNSEVLFTIEGAEFLVSDFSEYLAENFSKENESSKEQLYDEVDKYIDFAIIAYEDSKLESKYPEFRNLINEYHDGILLFEISDKEVWRKASEDAKELAKYFKKHKKSYKWSAPRYKGYAVQCVNDSVANEVKEMIATLDADTLLQTITERFNSDKKRDVKLKKSIFKSGENNVVDYYVFHKGELPVTDKYTVAFVSGKLLLDGPEEYTDVKGEVISEYQAELEKRWIKSLNKKYKVEINQDVLSTITDK